MQDLEKQINEYILHYNQNRFHSSLGYITPMDMLQGRQQFIFSERKKKLYIARENRLRQRKLEESLNGFSLGKKQFA